jgi:hypothetical protein
MGKQSAAQSNAQGEQAEITRFQCRWYTTNRWSYAVR